MSRLFFGFVFCVCICSWFWFCVCCCCCVVVVVVVVVLFVDFVQPLTVGHEKLCCGSVFFSSSFSFLCFFLFFSLLHFLFCSVVPLSSSKVECTGAR